MRKSLKLAIIGMFNTQSNFAKSVGRSDSYVSNVVRGLKTPDSKEQRLWARQLSRYRKTLFA